MAVAEPYFSTPLPLKSRCIRLLRLHEALDLEGNDTIGADLEVFQLDQCPEFSALSYVWATEVGRPRSIICHGAAVKISENCFWALKHIKKIFGTRYVWVDAICINQQDDSEKARQIPLMGSIFSGAGNVYVWLGRGSIATYRAISALQSGEPFWLRQLGRNLGSGSTFNGRIWSIIIKACFKRRSWQICQEPQNDRKESRTSVILRPSRNAGTSINSIATADLEELLLCAWIRRIWTYQELMLARNPIIVCGAATIPWIDFSRKIAALECMAPTADNASLSSTLSTWRAMAFARSRLRTMLHHSSGSKDFQSYAHEQWNVRNPRRLTYTVSHIRNVLKPWMLIMCLSSIILSIDAVVVFMDWGSRKSIIFRVVFLANLFCWMVCLIPSVMYLLVRCTTLPWISKANINSHYTQPTTDDLVDVLCSRQASNTKDKAFALYTTLEYILDRPITQPDYALSLCFIYRDLTLNLLRATASMKTILAASICRIRDSPSWVADWSGEFSEYWLKPSLNSKLNMDATLGSTSFHEYDSEIGLLRLRGRKACSVRVCSSLHATKRLYCNTEDSIHVENLNITRQLFGGCATSRNSIDETELQEIILNTGYHSNMPLDISPSRILAYREFLYRYSHESSSSMLTLLKSQETMTCNRSDNYGSRWKILEILRWLRPRRIPYQEIMRTHIAICNSLARSQQKFFWTQDMVPRCFNSTHTTNPQKCWRAQDYWSRIKTAAFHSAAPSDLLGLCTNDVQPGDEVLLIAGLFMPIVVRSHGETFHIISPAIIPGIMQGQAWHCRMRSSEEENLDYFRIS